MNALDFPINDIRRENRQTSELGNFAKKLAESLLPAGYVDYRARVRRWRAALDSAGLELEKERSARSQANAKLAEAKLMDQQLRQTEQEKGWIRTCIL